MLISFNTQDCNFKLKKKSLIREWIKLIAEKEKRSLGNINYIFCSEGELLKINIQYLNHHTLTDIITFDYTENNTIAGDIFINPDRIIENAQKYNVTFEEELRRVIIHGILHLCGYKDKKSEEEKLMRKKEDKALKELLALENS